MQVYSDSSLILYLREAVLTVIRSFWRWIAMDVEHYEKELQMKEQRVLYWDRFGVVFPDNCLKELVPDDKEVGV
jgi:hypothetical protein